jgi:hypothetical protein
MQFAFAHNNLTPNPAMGIYFINDPDDYWIEIIPRKRPWPPRRIRAAS